MAGAQKRDLIREELLHRLLTRRYVYGQRILVKEIGEETGVSRQPIMAALNALSSEGFVTILPQIGCEIVSPDARDIGDFYRMFALSEGLMAELAAVRGTDMQLAQLAGINLRIRALDHATANASEQYRRFNHDFHGQIHAMAATPMLHERQRNIFEMSDFFIVQSAGFGPHMAEAADEHDRIIAALQARDPDAARDAMKAHIAAVRNSIVPAAD